ncbi:MAG: DNA gyrase subunit B [Candidatus Micrarchaeota archaeon]|nr:DNA gyrase subunit B [Candidatus Micrarchaeota archaeon]MDE1851501.1 DNA gyrase subunit B [Candidatus Micrarchaeota archaeon]
MSAELVNDSYNASKIVVLEGPQGIRKRPAMYIGSTGPSGVLHLLYEVVDNAVDEAIAGYCKNISIRLFREDSGDIAEVTDDGRGIPIDTIEKYNKSALEVIMTTLHKGAKFNNDVYKVSGGLHGVGLTVVNALSEYTDVTVRKDGHTYRQSFSRGIPSGKIELIGDTNEKGTTIRFKPDKDIFSTLVIDSTILKERLRYTAFLNPGLRITLTDERFESKETEEFASSGGLADFISFLNKDAATLTNIIQSKRQEGTVTIEFALQYVDTYEEKLDSFVNNIKTPEGGTHVSGMHSAITRAIMNYIDKNKINVRDIRITGEDTREGLTAILSVLMQNPEFEGQTKEKLGNASVKGIVDGTVYANMSRYLEEHPADAKAIMGKVMSAASARESARKARDLARKKNIFDSTVLPGKLADCIDSNPENTELFIVEGASAGGSAKEGRDKSIQAILPLRGKILNVEKAGDERIFDNAEIKAMVTAFGTGIKETFNSEAIRYKKIIIMTDADVDGSHIRTLLLTFFYRYMKKIIESGYVFAAQPPLYKISKGKNEAYCYNDAELAEKMKELGEDSAVQRYKGLGEMNQEQLWDTTMNPKNRRLKKLTIADAARAEELFKILMGVDVPQRRKFLQEHAEEVKTLDV